MTTTTTTTTATRVCVFLGSSLGNKPVYREVAAETGRVAAERGLTVVYGGGMVGCMGVLANAALDAGGKVVGVIPQFMVDKEVALLRCTQLHIVQSMHDRKLKMQNESDAFIVLAGGLGTLEELFEIVTWRKLAIHHKPLVFVNTDGFYDDLFTFLEKAAAAGFIAADDNDWYHVAPTPAAAYDIVAEVIARPPKTYDVYKAALTETLSAQRLL